MRWRSGRGIKVLFRRTINFPCKSKPKGPEQVEREKRSGRRSWFSFELPVFTNGKAELTRCAG